MAPSSLNVPSNQSCRKRPADEELDSEPPIKKFGLLNIVDEKRRDRGGKHLDESPKREGMLLDDTKYTSYVHDIDREIEDIESHEEHIVFLPDIEKTLAAIPRAVLGQPKPRNNELVLYRPPEYFAAPVEIPQAKEESTNAVSSSKPRSITVNRVLRRRNPDNTDDRRLLDAQDDMDIDP